MKRNLSILLFLCFSIIVPQQSLGQSPIKNIFARIRIFLRPTDFSSAIRKIAPSVVFIRSLAEHDEPEPHLDVVFSGTGVIVSSDGFILTNAHLVLNQQKQRFEKIEALVNQEKYLPAKIIGIDREKDLALIKVDASLLSKKMIPVKFRQTDRLAVGQTIWKAGFPDSTDSESPTFGHGFITNTRVFNHNYSTPYVAFDAHISGGDSGGPIFNVSGGVVGITTLMGDGIGLFIPTKIVLITLPKLYRGDVRASWLGISPKGCLDMQDISKDDRLKLMAREFFKKGGATLPDIKRGVAITRFDNAMAGDARLLQVRDVITRVNQKIPRDKYEFVQWIAEAEPGAMVSLDIIRNGKKLLMLLRVGEYNWKAPRQSTASEEHVP